MRICGMCGSAATTPSQLPMLGRRVGTVLDVARCGTAGLAVSRRPGGGHSYCGCGILPRMTAGTSVMLAGPGADKVRGLEMSQAVRNMVRRGDMLRRFLQVGGAGRAVTGKHGFSLTGGKWAQLQILQPDT